MKKAPIETPGVIGTVEKYHASLRSAYDKLRRDLARDLTDKQCLDMAVFAINATIAPEGLFPMLLEFKVIPRPARKTPSAIKMVRAETIEKAMHEVRKVHVRMRIAFGLKHTEGPKALEISEKLRRLPAGSPVVVYRRTKKRWEGPLTYISIDGETVVVQTGRRRRIFR